MILIDFSAIAHRNLHVQLKESGPQLRYNKETGEIEQLEDEGFQPKTLRQGILNSIRRIKKEFGVRYGQLVICTDNSQYWRKTAFQYYKANRKKTRDESGIDWREVFKTFDQIRDELQEIFPYKIMNVPLAEADDIIGVLTKKFKTTEPILIVSSDKDFIQLIDYNVTLYRPSQDEIVSFNPSDPIASPQVAPADPCFDLLSCLEEI